MIRKLISIMAVILLFAACSKHDYTKKFSVVPEKPSAGDEITILFNANDTKLANAEKVNAVVYQFNVDLEKVDEYPMTKEENGWFAKLKTDAATRGIAVVFNNGDELLDNNDGNGYFYAMYKDGKEDPGYKAGLAVGYYNWFRMLDMEADRNKAYSLMNEAFQNDSTIKRAFIAPYIRLTASIAQQNAGMLIQAELENLEKYNDLTDDELALMVEWFARTPARDKAEKYKKIALEKFPNGKVAENELYNKFRAAKSVDDQLNIIHEYKSKFPEGEYNEGMVFGALRKTLNEKKYDMTMMIFQHASEDLHPYYFGYAANKLMADGFDLDKIESILKKGIKKGEAEVNKPDSEKPATTTLRDWREGNRYYLGTNYGALGKLLLKKDDKEGALEAYRNSVELTKDFYSNPEFNLAYAKLLVDLNKNQEAKDVISEFVKKGDATTELKELLKKAFVNLNGSEEGFDSYLADLEGIANKELVAKLKGEIMEEPAPDFTLTDLDGKEVTLSELKGKTVIVDFWATWCGPCKKSFPGMKKAVEKFAGNENVKFLFVNTWERVEDKKANASKFIKENNYPFQVLLDEENKVVEQFNVQGIPTKFVIDKNGNIRFKSVGFSGNADGLVDELSAMISMIQ